MLANETSTAETMLRAIAYTLAALAAAAEIDVDRSPEDNDFFKKERSGLQPLYDTLFEADRKHTAHLLSEGLTKQACVVVGDAVLDRGVRMSKARMKVELKPLGKVEQADHAFGADVRDIVDAERAEEPKLVLEAVAKFAQVADFPGKAAMATDLTSRANKQKQNFADRDAAQVVEATLAGAVKVAIEAGATGLYKTQKRLEDRFPKQDTYVRAFLLDVAKTKKKPVATTSGDGTPE